RDRRDEALEAEAPRALHEHRRSRRHEVEKVGGFGPGGHVAGGTVRLGDGRGLGADGHDEVEAARGRAQLEVAPAADVAELAHVAEERYPRARRRAEDLE